MSARFTSSALSDAASTDTSTWLTLRFLVPSTPL
jgi:hypothetical protein